MLKNVLNFRILHFTEHLDSFNATNLFLYLYSVLGFDTNSKGVVRSSEVGFCGKL